jgi:hypothetical protein
MKSALSILQGKKLRYSELQELAATSPAFSRFITNMLIDAKNFFPQYQTNPFVKDFDVCPVDGDVLYYVSIYFKDHVRDNNSVIIL